MADLDTGTDTDQPADDIRSQLEASFTEAESSATGQPDLATGKTAPDTGTDITGGERVRDAAGKFLKKDPASQEASPGTAAKPEKAAAPAATDPTTQQPTATDSKEPPAHWSQADKDKFKAQPPEAQTFILDRTKAMEGDYTRKTQEVAHLKKEYGPVDELFAPHRDVMRQKGFSPRSLIEAWANVEQKLAAGPDSAIEVIKGLVGGYNIPVAKIAAALGVSQAQVAAATAQPGQQATAVENGQVVPIPPQVQQIIDSLQQKVNGFEQKFGSIEQREANATRAREVAEETAIETQVNEFKSAVDEKGQSLHPHFDEVYSHMNALAQAALASKQQPFPSLKELYETAVWANPSTREKVLTAKSQQEEKERTEAARVKAASARRAGSSVTGAPGSGQAPSGRQASELSLREQLEAAADDEAA